MNPTLVVMAAGMATRYDGIKQMDAVGPGAESILEYTAYDAIRAGFGKVVCVIRPDIEADFREAIGKRIQDRIAVDYISQDFPETRTVRSPSLRRVNLTTSIR